MARYVQVPIIKLSGKERKLATASALCAQVLTQFEREYGRPVTMGSVYRWAIPNHDPRNPIVLAIDDCEDALVKAWVFDVHERSNNGVIEFMIRSAAEIDSVVTRIRETVLHLVARSNNAS